MENRKRNSVRLEHKTWRRRALRREVEATSGGRGVLCKEVGFHSVGKGFCSRKITQAAQCKVCWEETQEMGHLVDLLKSSTNASSASGHQHTSWRPLQWPSWRPGPGLNRGMGHAVQMCNMWAAERRQVWDFPGDAVAKTPRSQHRGPRFDPWSGN